MSNPLVSIIVPNFNTPLSFLNFCFDSIKEQTFKDFEVIIVDDGSSNEKYEVLLELLKDYKFEYTIIQHSKNRGIAVARNTGVKEAKGKYIYFISSDDAMMPETLELFVREMGGSEDIILYSDYVFINEQGGLLGPFKAPSFINDKDFKIAIWRNALKNTMFVCFDVIFIPSRIIKENLFLSKLRYGEDLEWLLRISLINDVGFKHIPGPLARYRLHQQTSTAKVFKDIPKNNVFIRARIKKMLKEKYKTKNS